MTHYRNGQKRGYESGLVILTAEGQRPMAGFSVPLPAERKDRQEFLRGFAQGLLDASDAANWAGPSFTVRNDESADG